MLEWFYNPHHQKLKEAVGESLPTNIHCLILESHSFPTLPLPCELNQTAFRPDFCLKTDDFHTPEKLIAKVEKILESFGYSTARDQPFIGTIFPMKHYHKDQRVQSLMIEINRWLYLGKDYWVASQRLETLVEILRRVGEVPQENWFTEAESQTRTEILTAWVDKHLDDL